MTPAARCFLLSALLGGLTLGGCGHRAAREAAARSILMKKAEVEAATQTACAPDRIHSGFTEARTIGVHACGEWLEYDVHPPPCSRDGFLRSAPRSAAHSCRLTLR